MRALDIGMTGALVALLLSACALPGTKERAAMANYLLEGAAPRGAPGADATCGMLEVMTPRPAPGFGTPRIAYQTSSYRIEYFAFAQWVDTPSQMLAPAMVAALDDSGLFAGVLSGPASSSVALRLESEDLRLLQSFSQDQRASQATIRMRAHLLEPASRELLGSWSLSAAVDSAPDPDSGVAAANAAVSQLLENLVSGIAAAIAADGLCTAVAGGEAALRADELP